MQNELFSEGLTLMLAGMGTVFVFLTALVIAMTVMSRLVMRMQPASVVAHATQGNEDEIAAIAAAIARHRRK
ncbi:MAG: OadG family transporter subunit [Woeseiaceae bacterium]|jgi:oxaloacetate decarboxylase gamma subunit